VETRQAIISFAQSEKIKSGLIWCSQCADLAHNLPTPEQIGAMRLVQSLVGMILSEAQLARQASGDVIWLEAERAINTARVMIDSGVGHEVVYHFTQALSQVNRIGQKAMSELIAKGLIS
jgi:hypothetical protein